MHRHYTSQVLRSGNFLREPDSTLPKLAWSSTTVLTRAWARSNFTKNRTYNIPTGNSQCSHNSEPKCHWIFRNLVIAMYKAQPLARKSFYDIKISVIWPTECSSTVASFVFIQKGVTIQSKRLIWIPCFSCFQWEMTSGNSLLWRWNIIIRRNCILID
jgi:hypothetical protein